jgi:Flp pilus assembly protein TadD
MSYQFELNRSNRSLRFPVILMAGLVVTALAAYTFAACGDRNPDQARASERVSQPTGDVSSGTSNVGTTTEKPALVISGPVSFEIADSAYRERRYDDATVLFKTYAEGRPSNPWGFYMLGLSAWRSGDRAQAESAFVQALSIDSTHEEPPELEPRAARGWEADSALSTSSGRSPSTRRRASRCGCRGGAFEAQGKTDDAIVAYQHAIAKNDSDTWAMNNLGVLYTQVQRFEDAIGPLARAIELDDQVAAFHNNLGMALELTGRFEQAVEQYRAALAIEGTYGKAVSNLQRVQQVKQDPSVTPADLTERSKQFQEEVTRW